MSTLKNPLLIGCGLATLLSWPLFRLYRSGSREKSLPPGPPTIPILGNLTILPTTDSYLKYTQWAREYGDIYSLKVGSNTVIVVSSLEAISDIFIRQGAYSAGRPPNAAMERIGGTAVVWSSGMPGQTWRRWRRALMELTKPSACIDHIPIQTAECHQLMFDIQRDPENFFQHTKRTLFSSIFSIMFGVRTPSFSAPVLVKLLGTVALFTQIYRPGDIPPVDLFPILKLIPDRWAGNWRTRADTVKRLLDEIFFGLADDADQREKRGLRNGCFFERLKDRAVEWDLSREDTVNIAASNIIASIGPTSSSILFALLLATSFPETQHKVHEELDRVVGRDRAPTLDDIPNLPYFQAFLKEMFRFRPIHPLGNPHYTSREITHKNFILPEGTTLLPNVWALFHDPNLFENPDTFDPDRYIRTTHGLKPEAEKQFDSDMLKRLDTLVFGTGRRICPGMHLGSGLANLTVVNLLWGFSFLPLKDLEGRDIRPDPWGFDAQMSISPLPFKCTITTRSQSHARIIQRNFAEATPSFKAFEEELDFEQIKELTALRTNL